jgi:transcriptional regulator with XRE-family HTH domain
MATSDALGRNIRAIREDRELSMSALAQMAGMSKQTISSIEAGIGNPTVNTVDDIARARGVATRSLFTDIGSETLFLPGRDERWRERGLLQLRDLDQAYGSGYVYNSVLRLQANRGVAHMRAATLGTLRHCYVVEGRVRLGLESAPVTAQANDFVRFSGDSPHIFEAITPIALVFVCSTSPQVSMSNGAEFD